MKTFSIIVAADDKYWIWKSWDLIWHIPSDLKYFKKITSEVSDTNKKNALIMWRTTWESIPEKYRPLPWRLNCVLSSREMNLPIEVLKFSEFNFCLWALSKIDEVKNIFVIWWAQLYNSVADSEYLDTIYFTKVFWDFSCDVFIEKIWKLIESWKFEKTEESEIFENNWIEFQFLKYCRAK